jgi:hypothetical protein
VFCALFSSLFSVFYQPFSPIENLILFLPFFLLILQSFIHIKRMYFMEKETLQKVKMQSLHRPSANSWNVYKQVPWLTISGNWLNYNRYSYCINNPFKYTDPTGEYFGIDDLIGFVIGSTINLISNVIQGNIHSFGQGLAAFGVGGAAQPLALYGPAGWVAGGAIVGGTNAWPGGATGWYIAKGTGIGAISGLAGGAAGQW